MTITFKGKEYNSIKVTIIGKKNNDIHDLFVTKERPITALESTIYLLTNFPNLEINKINIVEQVSMAATLYEFDLEGIYRAEPLRKDNIVGSSFDYKVNISFKLYTTEIHEFILKKTDHIIVKTFDDIII